MRGRTKIVIALLVVVVIVGAVYAFFKDDIAQLWADLHAQIAEYPQPKKTVWLDQDVSKEKLSWFYHADQGTRTFGIPYEWFMALEQPTFPWCCSPHVATFSDPAYLDRYGFIPDTIHAREQEPSRCRSASPRAARCWTRRALAQPERPGRT